MRVGDIEIHPVLDGLARLEPSAAYLRTPDEAWEPHRRFLATDGMFELALGGFLIKTEDKLVLVDLGIGPVHAGPFRGGDLLESLRALDVEPADITDIVLSHLHFDHIGWASMHGEPVFDRATYRCSQPDWDHFVTEGSPQPPRAALFGPAGGAVGKLASISERVETWSSDGRILPGLDAMAAPGHTPGSTIIVVSDGAARALLLGDVVHCPVELLDDEWEGLADVDPELAKRTRATLTKELEGTDVPVAAGHFPGLEFGRLLFGEGKRQWVV